MNDKHVCCSCPSDLKATLKNYTKELKKLKRDLKTAQRRIFRLKTQKQKLLTDKKKKRVKAPTFFK